VGPHRAAFALRPLPESGLADLAQSADTATARPPPRPCATPKAVAVEL
jgi:hypothetical protein